ncbi:50S ribosomal protein L32 [Planctomycetota bacterium]
MAVPKHKTSKARRDKRRSHLKIKQVSFSVCPECGQSTLPHRVCKCGFYKGIEYIPTDE